MKFLIEWKEFFKTIILVVLGVALLIILMSPGKDDKKEEIVGLEKLFEAVEVLE